MDNATMIQELRKVGIRVESGMTAHELDCAEKFFQFRFPREIREFLSCGMPIGASFFNYRDLSRENLVRFHKFQDAIESSFRFDLANNREDMIAMFGEMLNAELNSEAFDDAVIGYLKRSVRLIPFYAHRCFFDGMDDMPIISFWQAVDTVFYGGTFVNYLEVEFLKGDRVLENIEERMRAAGIWGDLIM